MKDYYLNMIQILKNKLFKNITNYNDHYFELPTSKNNIHNKNNINQFYYVSAGLSVSLHKELEEIDREMKKL